MNGKNEEFERYLKNFVNTEDIYVVYFDVRDVNWYITNVGFFYYEEDALRYAESLRREHSFTCDEVDQENFFSQVLYEAYYYNEIYEKLGTKDFMKLINFPKGIFKSTKYQITEEMMREGCLGVEQSIGGSLLVIKHRQRGEIKKYSCGLTFSEEKGFYWDTWEQ